MLLLQLLQIHRIVVLLIVLVHLLLRKLIDLVSGCLDHGLYVLDFLKIQLVKVMLYLASTVWLDLMMRWLLREEAPLQRLLGGYLLVWVLPLQQVLRKNHVLLFWLFDHCNLVWALFSPGKHERVHRLAIFLLQFFHSIRVPEGVQSMLATRAGWGNIGNHDCTAFWACEGIFEDLGKFTPSEWGVFLILV